DQAVGHVHAESVHAAVQPEPQDVVEFGADLFVLPVQVRLVGVEQVQVPLPGRAVGLGHAGPGVNAEHALPGRGRLIAVLAAPRPSRKRYRSRSGEPGAACRAAWNQRCSSEVWLGTRSTITRRPRSWAAAMSRSASARVPNRGSTWR